MSKAKTCKITGIKYKISKKSDWDSIPLEKRIISFEISLNNHKCSDENLLLLMNWARDKFTYFDFCLGDTLNSYTYVALNNGDLDTKNRHWFDAEKKFRKNGNEWIKKNIKNIESVFGNNYNIIRWSKWRNHPLFSYYFGIFKDNMNNNRLFRDAVHSDVTNYLERNKHFEPARSIEKVNFISNYILEELTVYTIQARENNIVNVYPGGAFKVFNLIKDIESIPEQLKTRKFIYFDLKNTN